MQKKTSEQGFTLIEIAIVLVIVGLLLGSILKGQELINSARVRSLAQQSAGIQAAYFGFIDRYRKVPGDHPGSVMSAVIGETVHLPTGGAATNGNGRIDNTLEEAAAVWEQLTRAGFLSGGYRPASTSPVNAAAYADGAPRNPFGGALVLTHNRAYSGAASKRLNLHLGANIPVRIASELDARLDDGMPNTGLLRLSDTDGEDTAFDGALFTPTVADCTTVKGATAAGNPPGTGAATDIYDRFDDASDCQPVLLLY